MRLYDRALCPGDGVELVQFERNFDYMSRKTVRVAMPDNIEDTVDLIERVLLRNDGSLPAVPQSTAYVTLGALLGLSVPAVGGGTGGTSPPAPPGTHKVPEEIAAPLRTMFPTMKRNYLDYVALKGLLQTTSNTLQTQLGLSAGQTVQTAGTARNLIGRAAKVLLGVFAGNESELETYGFQVVVSTAAGPSSPPTPVPAS